MSFLNWQGVYVGTKDDGFCKAIVFAALYFRIDSGLSNPFVSKAYFIQLLFDFKGCLKLLFCDFRFHVKMTPQRNNIVVVIFDFYKKFFEGIISHIVSPGICGL